MAPALAICAAVAPSGGYYALSTAVGIAEDDTSGQVDLGFGFASVGIPALGVGCVAYVMLVGVGYGAAAIYILCYHAALDVDYHIVVDQSGSGRGDVAGAAAINIAVNLGRAVDGYVGIITDMAGIAAAEHILEDVCLALYGDERILDISCLFVLVIGACHSAS